MNTQSSRLTDGEPLVPSPVVQEITMMPGIGQVISVRAAKAHLSALIEEVVRGREVTITSAGRPKARLVAVEPTEARPVFAGAARHLATMPTWKGGKSSEELVREERDARGW